MHVQAEVVRCTGAQVWQLRAEVTMLSLRCGMHLYTPEYKCNWFVPILVLCGLCPTALDTRGHRCHPGQLCWSHSNCNVCRKILQQVHMSFICLRPHLSLYAIRFVCLVCVIVWFHHVCFTLYWLCSIPLCYRLVVWFCIPNIFIYVRIRNVLVGWIV